MIEETGSVVEVRGEQALVETQRSSGCGHCSAKGACASLGGGREARVWVENAVGARVGERVVVAVPEGTVLRASVLLYLVPVIALVTGAVAGNRWGPALGLSADLGAAGTGVAAMALAFLGVRHWGGVSTQGPRIVRRG